MPTPPMLLLLLLLACQGQTVNLLGEVRQVEALLGGKAAMPCDVTPKDANDTLLMLVWYKGTKPIYSYDGRLQKHWRSADQVGGQEGLLFSFHASPPALLVGRVRQEDQGVYRCRADFLMSPTRNQGVRLMVVILPSKPFFMDEIGSKVEHTVGPLHEGDNLLINCLVVGGQPPPRLSWWKLGTLLDSSDEDSEVPGVRENQLLVPLTRDYAWSRIQCMASNNNISAPLSSALTVQLYVSPETVTILSSKQALSAGRLYELPCYVNGSYPLPEVVWWLDGHKITDQLIVTEPMKNEVISRLHLRAHRSQHGRELSCVATNKALAPNMATKLSTLRLNIFFPPVVSLTLIISGVRPVEGEVLQLRCMVDANPWITNTEWFANNRTIQGSSLNGSSISLSSSDLLIFNSTSQHTGNYSCMAFNLEGSGMSNVVHIEVAYKPKCTQNETAINETSSFLQCPLESVPKADRFYWRIENINNSSKFNENILITDNNSISLEAVHRALGSTAEEDIMVSCWGRNQVAEQKEHCFLDLGDILSVPQPPEDCNVHVETDALIVNCSNAEVGNKSLAEQQWEVSVWGALNTSVEPEASVNSHPGAVHIGGLRPGQTYRVLVYATNKWGRSLPSRLMASTQEAPPALPHDSTEADIGLWSGVLVATLLIVFFMSVVCIIKRKHRASAGKDKIEKGDIDNRISDKQHYDASNNADITEKPLLYDKNNSQNNIIIVSKNNTQPKNIESISLVLQNSRNGDTEQSNSTVPPAVSRRNKPRLPVPNGRINGDRKWPPKARKGMGSDGGKMESKVGAVKLDDLNGGSNAKPLRSFRGLTMSKESIV